MSSTLPAASTAAASGAVAPSPCLPSCSAGCSATSMYLRGATYPRCCTTWDSHAALSAAAAAAPSGAAGTAADDEGKALRAVYSSSVSRGLSANSCEKAAALSPDGSAGSALPAAAAAAAAGEQLAGGCSCSGSGSVAVDRGRLICSSCCWPCCCRVTDRMPLRVWKCSVGAGLPHSAQRQQQ